MNQQAATLIDTAEQEKLIVRIVTLANWINQAGIAEATIHLKSQTLNASVHMPFAMAAVYSTQALLSDHETNSFTRMRQMFRLREIVRMLERIFEDGMAPKGGAA